MDFFCSFCSTISVWSGECLYDGLHSLHSQHIYVCICPDSRVAACVMAVVIILYGLFDDGGSDTEWSGMYEWRKNAGEIGEQEKNNRTDEALNIAVWVGFALCPHAEATYAIAYPAHLSYGQTFRFDFLLAATAHTYRVCRGEPMICSRTVGFSLWWWGRASRNRIARTLCSIRSDRNPPILHSNTKVKLKFI